MEEKKIIVWKESLEISQIVRADPSLIYSVKVVSFRCRRGEMEATPGSERQDSEIRRREKSRRI